MINNNAVIRRLKVLQQAWEIKRVQLINAFNAGYKPTVDDLEIYLPGVHLMTDWSLIYDTGIFRYKPIETLIKLWKSSYSDVVGLQQIIIDYQTKHGKAGDLTKEELIYTGILINMISWVTKHKFGMNQKERREITSGNLKDKSHFTIKNKIGD